jgi:hypothetical protein
LFSGNNTAFNEFLGQTDASGLHTYRDLATAYNNNFDATRMAVVVNTFLKTQGIEAEVVAPAAAAAPVAAQPAAQVATAQQAVQPAAVAQPVVQPKTDHVVAPNRTAPAMPAQIASDQVRTWNPQSKAQFEMDDREGLYTSEQSKALWDDLMLSPGEGRFYDR